MAVGAATSLDAAAVPSGGFSGASEPSTFTAHSPTPGHSRNRLGRMVQQTARAGKLADFLSFSCRSLRAHPCPQPRREQDNSRA